MTAPAEPVTTCALCGDTWQDGDVPTDWLNVEITRLDEAGATGWLEEDFCSQEHAAQWLARPLPTPQPWQPYEPTRQDRLAAAAFAAVVGVLLALVLLGLVTAVRFLL